MCARQHLKMERKQTTVSMIFMTDSKQGSYIYIKFYSFWSNDQNNFMGDIIC